MICESNKNSSSIVSWTDACPVLGQCPVITLVGPTLAVLLVLLYMQGCGPFIVSSTLALLVLLYTRVEVSVAMKEKLQGQSPLHMC